jgi:hypothetical protein
MSVRMRFLAPLVGAVVAALGVATIAAAQSALDDDGTNRSYAFVGGTTEPGCTTGGPTLCVPFTYTFRLLAVPNGEEGKPWGLFQRRNHGTGGIYTGRIACTTIEGNRAVIGGYLTASAVPEFLGEPFIVYVEDGGPLGSSSPDRISLLAALPPGDPDLALVPERFPRVCPSVDSNPYGWLPIATGDVTVSER